MASTFSTNLAIELIGTGDQAGTWGVTTNTNLGTLIEQAISGYVTQAVSTGADTTITIPNGATGVARNMYIELTGTGGTNTNLIVPSNKKLYFIFNNTSSGQVTVKVSGQTGVSVPNGKKVVLVCNGTDIVNGLNYIADFGTNSFTVTNLTATSATITNLIATTASVSDASATVLRASSATLTHLSATSASITNLALTSLTISSLSITNVSVASATVSSNLTLSGGTANGVLYLNGSKVATSGSGLQFDGTRLFVGTTTTSTSSTQSGEIYSTGAVGFMLTNTTAANFPVSIKNEGSSGTRNLIRFYEGPAGGTVRASVSLDGSNYLTFDTNNFIINTGNLGIGTASPGYKLSVAGASGSAVLNLLESGVRSWGIRAGGTATNTFDIADFTAGATRLTIDSSGNLGIGTASPASKLDTAGTIRATSQTVPSSGTGAELFYDATNAGLRGYNRTGSAYVNLALNDNVYIGGGSSGNLGIGTTSPTSKLDLVGIMQWQATAGTVLGKLTYSGGEPVVLANTGLGLQFFTNNAFAAKIDSSGNLGLGVTPTNNTLGKTLQVGQAGAWVAESGSNRWWLASNWYYNSGDKYINNGFATLYSQQSGQHQWLTAPSGTAGNTISFTQAMTLDASGNLLVGGTSQFNSSKACVVGSISSATSGVDGTYTPILFGAYASATSQASAIAVSMSSIGANCGFQFQVSSGVDANRTVAYQLNRTQHIWSVGGTEAARITSGGLFQVVATGSNSTFTDGGQISLKESGNSPYISWHQSTGARIGYLQMASGGNCSLWVEANQSLVFATNNTERGRFTSGGYFKASDAGTYFGSTSSYHELRQSSATDACVAITATSGSYTSAIAVVQSDRAASSAFDMLLARTSGGGDIEFNLRGDGNAYADGTWNNNGADYAEYFESSTGGALTVGATVVLDGNKVREATASDPVSAIMGVVRPKEPGKASMVVGNTAWNKWANKYLTDDFDRYIMEDHDVVEWTDEDGKQHSYESHNIPADVTVPADAVVKTHDEKGNKFQHYKLNPAWDKDAEYTPREKRDEWIIVGLVGQVKVLKGKPVNDRWIKMRDVSAAVEEWMIR